MRHKNICKFISSSTPDKLETVNFIYESNPEIMKTPALMSHHRIILITSGNGKLRFDDNEIVFDAGYLVFGFKNETFSVIFDNPCEYMYISFDGTRSDPLFHRFGINKTTRSFSDFDSLIPLWSESLSRASEENIDLTAEGILLYTLSRLSGSSSKQNNLINEIIEISEELFTDSALSLSSIASELGYNPKYISHLFKKKMGMGYSQYLRNPRIKYAISLFDHGIDSVKNVAFLSGFSDPSYFSTVFKKIIGTSPKEYKERNNTL